MGKFGQFVKKMITPQSSDDGDQLRRTGSGRLTRRLSSSFSSRASSLRSARTSSTMSSRSSDMPDCVDGSCDCVEDCCASSAPDVPAGYLPVYVGEERRRFVVSTTYLANSAFQALLAKSEEEFGLRCDGGLRIACFPDAFEHLLWSLQSNETEQ